MKLKGLAISLLLAAMSSTAAFATTLAAGTGNTAVSSQAALRAGDTLYLAPFTVAGTPGMISPLYGSLTEAVYKESGTGFLDFVYQFTVMPGAGSTGAGIVLATLDSFGWDGGATSDNAYILTGALSGFAAPSGPNPTPGFVDRSAGAGDRIHFDWAANSSFGPGTTAIFVVETQATSTRPGIATLSDDGQYQAVDVAPSPEPRTFMLSGLLALGLVLAARRYRAVQS